jgi:class III poly(R)-hydroxyalkanoic acid synthase PhaE subunit
VSSNPFFNPFLTLMTAQWQALAQQGMNALAETNAQTVKTALDQFQTGQSQMAQLTSLVTQAWGEVVAKGPASEWPAALTAYLGQLRQQMAGLAEKTPPSQQVWDFWQLYAQTAQKVSQPWLTFWQQTPTWFTPALSAPLAPLQSANQALGEALDQAWGGLLGAPTLGLNRQLQEKVNRWTALASENQQALREYQLLMGNVWLDAVGALLQKLMDLAQAGKSLETLRELLDLWVEVADARFFELFHSPAYASAQANLINSSMALRQQQRELLEIWLRQNDLPTRSDLDEAHHSIYELRKEVKALKKALHTLHPPTPPEPIVQTNRRRKRHPKAESSE